MINTLASKARLEAQLMELKERQDRIAQDLAEPLNPDFSEQAVQMENDIPLEGQAVLISREIASVMRALTRIENGTYGQCVRCGDDIAAKRLEARPEAALCIECARKEQSIAKCVSQDLVYQKRRTIG
jgi:RNA polymerase-binding protein DksA